MPGDIDGRAQPSDDEVTLWRSRCRGPLRRRMITVVNLASNLADTAGAHADRVAVRVGETAMSYRELDLTSAQVATLLRERGLRPGGRVGIMLPNVAEFAIIYYGVLRAGGLVVPMNPLLKKREVAYYLADSGARLIFAWHAFADEARSAAGGCGHDHRRPRNLRRSAGLGDPGTPGRRPC
jgi:acyl-CoA synthetase (AMP-forming)/AMP-acid ligase II